jgi:hypothetical protein
MVDYLEESSASVAFDVEWTPPLRISTKTRPQALPLPILHTTRFTQLFKVEAKWRQSGGTEPNPQDLFSNLGLKLKNVK